jgi:hypothetical protein
MLEQLTSWAGEAARWGPLIPLVPIAVLALIEAVILPARLWAKGAWVLLVVIACSLAGHVMERWEQANQTELGNQVGNQVSHQVSHQVDSELAKLKGLWARWDAIARGLPPAGEAPATSFDTVDDALASLSAKVASVEAQIAALREQLSEQTNGRSIDAETAAKLIDYLRQSGGYRVVVSCVPSDLEAYTYANQLVTLLTLAGWDARGPELTASDATAMGVSLYVRDPRTADAAKILIDAFIRFNIPYQTGLAASDAIPDMATVELFVAKKP